MNDKLLYWRRSIEVVAIVAALVLIVVFGKNVPAIVVPTLVGLLGGALAVGQTPMGNPVTVFKTKYPPPMVDVTADAVRIPTIPAPPPDMTGAPHE